MCIIDISFYFVHILILALKAEAYYKTFVDHVEINYRLLKKYSAFHFE